MSKSVSFTQVKTLLNLPLLLALLKAYQPRLNQQGRIFQGLKLIEVSLFALKESFNTKLKAYKDHFKVESCIKEKAIEPFLINCLTVFLVRFKA